MPYMASQPVVGKDPGQRKGGFETNLTMVLITHRIHGAGIYGNIYHQYTPNVSVYTSTMDPMGYGR